MIRHEHRARIKTSSSIVFLFAWLVSAIEVRTEELPFAKRIDHVVSATYRGPEIPLAGDYEFMRRVYLDLVGRSPTVEETHHFLSLVAASSGDPAVARQQLIDDLLARDEFSRYYGKVLEVIFTERREVIATLQLRSWIRQSVEERQPLNELCMELLGGDGTGEQLRAAGSFMINRNAEPNLVTRDIGRIFFGRDVQCAQCHDHPLIADYEQSEYFGILSFVNRTYMFTDEKRGNVPFLGEKGEGTLEFGSVFHPGDGKSVAEPVLPASMAMDAEPDFVDSSDAYVVAPEKDKRAVPRYSRRQQLAVLATHRENDAFNRNLANRLWAHMMGTGVVHPVDMHHSDNPPISAALLRLLTEELVAGNYDLREFLRQVARSDTYQRSVQAPDLSSWEGPPGGLAALEAEKARLQEVGQSLDPEIERLEAEMSEANMGLKRSQADVAKLQQKCDHAKKQLQLAVEQREKDKAILMELQAKQVKQQELIRSLQSAASESDKVLELTPDDRELAASRSLLNARLASANEAKATVDQQLAEQAEVVEESGDRADDLRSRVLALANRRLALGEFVVEARGVQRRLRKQIQSVVDQQSDCEQQRYRIAVMKRWLEKREEVRRATLKLPTDPADDQQKQLELLQADVLELWRRSYAIRRVRGLSPEQLTGATYTALEMYQPVREKALADWASNHQGNPTDAADVKKQQLFVNEALAANMWDTVEDLIVARFSFPAGAPQDGFFATVDQALTIQNDPAYQNWIKSTPGNLVERLTALNDSNQLVEQLYLSVLCRLPDLEERTAACELLQQHTEERASIVQELVWGLLASAEFRFML